MGKYEYNFVDNEKYRLYRRKAYEIIDDINKGPFFHIKINTTT